MDSVTAAFSQDRHLVQKDMEEAKMCFSRLARENFSQQLPVQDPCPLRSGTGLSLITTQTGSEWFLTAAVPD